MNGAPEREYMTSEEAARSMLFHVTAPSDPLRCFLRWAKRAGLTPARRGRRLLWDKQYLDVTINRDR